MKKGSYKPVLDMPDSRGRRQHYFLAIMFVALIIVVLFAASKILPMGPAAVMSNRQARKMLAEAESWENQSAILMARENYERISSTRRLDPKLRLQAVERLIALHRNHPNEIPNPQTIQATLEKAFVYTPPGPERETLRQELENLRGRPVAERAESAPVSKIPPPPARSSDNPLTASAKEIPIARVGNETVTMEEILYAWNQAGGGAAPTAENLKPFTQMYLDMVLMADEACRRNLDKQDRLSLDLRIKRIIDLNQYLMLQLINDIKVPDGEALKKYYESRKNYFARPATATIGHIAAKDPDTARKVAKSLDKGKNFKAVANELSADARNLKEGYILGRISAADEEIPHLGRVPGLAARLVEMADGATTGPLQIADGIHWIKIISRTAAQIQPFDSLKDEVSLDYQRQELARIREKLIRQLRESKKESVQVYDDKVKANVAQIEAKRKNLPIPPAPAASPQPTPDHQATGK